MLPNYIALLSELARELGEDDIAKIPENERANTVRRILSDRHALIIIDNLETFTETERKRVFQFLGRLPASCKAIVTSRRRTDVDARIVRLDKLSREAALKLIEELATRNKHLARATLESALIYTVRQAVIHSSLNGSLDSWGAKKVSAARLMKPVNLSRTRLRITTRSNTFLAI